MKFPFSAVAGAAAPTVISWFVLFGHGFSGAVTGTVVMANAPALAVAGVLSGNIHNPHFAVFALAVFAQWIGVVWGLIRLVCYLRARKT